MHGPIAPRHPQQPFAFNNHMVYSDVSEKRGKRQVAKVVLNAECLDLGQLQGRGIVKKRELRMFRVESCAPLLKSGFIVNASC